MERQTDRGHTQSVVTRLSPLQHPSTLSHTAHCIVHTTHYTFHTTALTGRSPLTAQISEAAGLPLRCSVYIMVRGIANLPEFLHDRPGKKKPTIGIVSEDESTRFPHWVSPQHRGIPSSFADFFA